PAFLTPLQRRRQFGPDVARTRVASDFPSSPSDDHSSRRRTERTSRSTPNGSHRLLTPLPQRGPQIDYWTQRLRRRTPRRRRSRSTNVSASGGGTHPKNIAIR